MREDELTRLVEKAGERQEVLRHIASEGGVLQGCVRNERRIEATVKSREKGRAQMAQDPEDPRHGTATGYVYGCPCERCRSEGKEALRARMRRKS